MPSIEDNMNTWNDPRSWDRRGDDWSDAWGSSVAMWYGTLMPRIGRRLPARTILEIACGHGRVTAFLLDQCQRYLGVDLAPRCVEQCEERFAGRSHASFHQTDGRSLPMVGDASVDFAISWDSLVHADKVAVGGYLQELSRVLVPGGFAFLHHSNLGSYVGDDGELTVKNEHWRDGSTSADVVQQLCVDAQLKCISQELVTWGLGYHSDCFTMLRRPREGEIVDFAAAPRRFENPHLDQEVGYSRMLADVYEDERSAEA